MVSCIRVHGGNMSADTWNPLTSRQDYPPGCPLGAKCWDGTIAWLTGHGHTAAAPELTASTPTTSRIIFGRSVR